MTLSEPLQPAGQTSPDGRSTETHRVVVFGHPEDFTVLKEILTQSASLHPDDAMTAARSAPGVLPGQFSQHVAEAVAAHIRLQGINAASLPESEIPKLDHAETVHHARCETEGLVVIGMHGDVKPLIRWSDLSLLSVGCVPVVAGHHLSAEPAVVVHAAPNPHQASTAAASHAGMILWIGCERPWTIYHIIHDQMNYEYLGKWKTASAMRNFALFVEDLSRRAPQAYLTPATRAFLQHGLRRHFEFESVDELRNYTVLHLLVTRRFSATQTRTPASES